MKNSLRNLKQIVSEVWSFTGNVMSAKRIQHIFKLLAAQFTERRDRQARIASCLNNRATDVSRRWLVFLI